ncbi:MAG TPA: tRNA pseudouridine(55) synthase TruB [Polyangiaceae bacterium]|nr:tRNA pseudouridine(55) synthase TruB [Polyangiaceae bacterium]
MKPPSALHGVLVVDKPTGMSSHDVVAEARRWLGTREVGHAGTLDPMATGVLVLMVGEACKLSGYLTFADKRYRARVQFGSSTDSLDADGQVTEKVELGNGWLHPGSLQAALDAELQRSSQVPPVISAIQQGGERAYRKARRGEVVELAARAVRLLDLQVLGQDDQHLDVELGVSKGYYVRAFARDLGLALGVPAHLSALRRLASGGFTLEGAAMCPLHGPPRLIPLEEAARRTLPITELTPAAVPLARQGKRLEATAANPQAFDQVSAWLAPDGLLVALGTSSPEGLHRVVRGFSYTE